MNTPNPNPSPELRALADIFDHFKHSKQGPGHCHDVPGIWDADNASDKAGKPCEWCAKWERARAVLIAPQTLPAPGEVEITRWLEAEQKRLDDEAGDYLMDTSDCINVIREKFATLATVAAANDEGVAEAFEAAARVAENPGFIEARDTEWDEGVNYAKRYIAAAIRRLATSRSQHEGASS